MNRNSGDVVWRSLFFNSLVVSGVLIFQCDRVFSQVTPDDTLGDESSVVNTRDATSDSIDGGAIRGQNLFHSFEEFNVGEDRGVYFSNPEAVNNIFSRVTGNNVSNILGTLGVDGAANLFLINPNGIVFGKGASLDVQGSFTATTADGIEFGEQGFFGVSNPESPKLLTINPSAYLFNQVAPGAIANSSRATDPTSSSSLGLSVQPEKNISLIGSDVSLNGGLISAPGGKVELGGLTAAGKIDINSDDSLSFPDNVTKSNVALSNKAVVDISSNGGGLITVNANNLELTGASQFSADIDEGLGSENAVAGGIEINSTLFSADNNSLIHSDNLGTGQAGTININSNILNFKGGSAITASTFGVGDAGIINITAQDISIDQEFSGIYSSVGLTSVATDEPVSDAEGNGGKITINTGDLTLNDGARIASNSVAQGNAGVVDINATGAVSFIGQGETFFQKFNGPVNSGSSAQVQKPGDGSAGQVNITADSLTLKNKGGVLVDNSGVKGDAGDITLDIQNNIFLDKTGLILAQIQGDAVGNGGEITIDAGSLEAKNDSQILADTKGQGDAGNITIDVEKTVALDSRSKILTEVRENSIGNAGDIDITANALVVQNGANITARTGGQGDAGKITVMTDGAINTVSLSNGGKIISRVEDGAAGKGGNISLTSGELNLTKDSEIIADTTAGEGNAGNIKIDVTGGDINLDNNSKIQSQTLKNAGGNAGDITINAGSSIFLTNGSSILADSQAEGNGGNIQITAGEQIVLEGLPEDRFPSQIVAGLSRENADGIGGSIEINAGELVLDDVAFISSNTVSNSEGEAGTITINADSLSLMNNSFINAFTANDDVAGAITINAQTLNLSSGGKILAATDGIGNAGNVNLNVSGDIQINNSIESSAEFNFFAILPSRSYELLDDLQESPSGIYADVTENATGSGGNINVTAGDIRLRGGSDIRTNVFAGTSDGGTSDGGNISITADSIVAFDDSDIFASAPEGKGGDITLNTPAYFGENFTLNSLTSDSDTLQNNSRADVNATGAVSSGAVDIPDVSSIQNGLNELPNNSLNTDELVANSCVVPVGDRGEGKFIITGTESLPVRPGDGIPSQFPTGEVRSVPEKQSSWQPGDPIVEPQGAYRLANGKLVLSRECPR